MRGREGALEDKRMQRIRISVMKKKGKEGLNGRSEPRSLAMNVKRLRPRRRVFRPLHERPAFDPARSLYDDEL